MASPCCMFSGVQAPVSLSAASWGAGAAFILGNEAMADSGKNRKHTDIFLARNKHLKNQPGTKVCSLCHRNFTGFGHNADPFEGRCCAECNEKEVMPARLRRMKAGL